MLPPHLLVLQRPDEALEHILDAWLSRHPLPEGPAERLVLLSPNWTPGPEQRPEALPPCAVLLLPSSAAPLASRFSARCAVSYGSGVRDSLTLSSLEGDKLVVAVQRELPAVTGSSVEQQELVLSLRRGVSPLPALAAAGALLLLGARPEELMADPPL